MKRLAWIEAVLLLFSSAAFSSNAASIEASCPRELRQYVLPVREIPTTALVSSIEFSPDGSRIVAGLADGTCLEVSTDGTVLQNVKLGKNQLIATYLDDQPAVSVAGGFTGPLSGYTVTPSSVPKLIAVGGDKIAVATLSKQIEVFHAFSRERIHISPTWSLGWFRARITAIAMSAKGDKLAVATFKDGVVELRVVDPSTGEQIHSGEISRGNLAPDFSARIRAIDPFRPEIVRLTFSQDGRTLLAAYSAYRNLESSIVEEVFSIPIDNPDNFSVAAIQDPTAWHVIDADTEVRLDPSGESVVVSTPQVDGDPFSPVGKPWVLRGRAPKTILYRRKGETFVPALKLVGHPYGVVHSAVHASGFVATSGKDGRLVIWDAREALKTEQPWGIAPSLSPIGVTTDHNGGIPFPPGYLFIQPKGMIYDPQGRQIQGTIVDESVGPLR